jgi:hypothetical protein
MRAQLAVLAIIGVVVIPLRPVRVSRQAVAEQLQKLGYPDGTWMIRRNSIGSRVYLYQSRWYCDAPDRSGLGDTGSVLVVEKNRVVQRLVSPAESAYLSDDGQFVAWRDDLKQGVTLKNGGHLGVTPVSGRFGVDWGGVYFFNGVANGSTKIGAIADPGRIIAVSRLKVPYSIFSGENKIYLCGADGAAAGGWGDWRHTLCEIYGVSKNGAQLIERRDVKDSMDVLDIDPATGRMLILGSRDFLPCERVLNLEDGTEARIGFASKWAFFLQPDQLGPGWK